MDFGGDVVKIMIMMMPVDWWQDCIQKSCEQNSVF